MCQGHLKLFLQRLLQVAPLQALIHLVQRVVEEQANVVEGIMARHKQARDIMRM